MTDDIANTTPSETDLAPHIEKWFWFDAVESSYTVTPVDGEVPRWLQGSYYINGPARFQRSGLHYRHWLDGDGMVCALHFGPDEIRFLNRFVRTRKLLDEEAAGKPIYRVFGTAFAGDRLRRGVMLESPNNVSVYPFAGRLLAFGEQTLPYELDPQTLETRGEFDFRGRLNEISPFSAHAKFDPDTGHMVNFGVSFSVERPTLHLYEFDRQGHMVRRRRCPLRFAISNHDFGLGQRHAVFFLSPLLMDFRRFWNEGASVMESLSWEPEKGSYILVVPRFEKRKAFEIESGSGHSLHLINCFEEDGHIILDVLELDGPVYPEYQPVPDLYQTKGPARPVRYVIDAASEKLVERIEIAHELGADFPSVSPECATHAYEDFWMLGISTTGQPGRKFFDRLIHGNWRQRALPDVFAAPPGHYFGGEPIYIAQPEEPAQGLVIIQSFDPVAEQVDFLLFEAHQVSRGPLVRLPLRHKIHAGFHASFWHR